MGESLYAAEGTTSDYVTTDTNVTGQLTPVLEIQPDDGVGLIIKNAVDVGQKRSGFPIYADLRDSGDNPLPLDTQVAIGYESPTDDSLQVVSIPLSNISSFRKKTIQEQQNRENVDSVKVELKSGRLEIRDIDKAYLLLDSSAQIDHANSEVYIEPDAVEEVDIE
ncbi:hypothetical protein [Haloarchaeobius sp. TZWSO28]|uniref:hypothetical protein n=1 Tax=Haloarchaeobius sp. TZWSO28 TaxID=3446119 RepID=UPI003EB7CB4B